MYFQQCMLNLSLNDENIKCILDNDIKKHNRDYTAHN